MAAHGALNVLTCCQQYTYAKSPAQQTRWPGFLRSREAPLLTMGHVNEQVTAAEAAQEYGLTTAAICNWVRRGHLRVAGIDHLGRKTYRKIDLEKVNHATRERARKIGR